MQLIEYCAKQRTVYSLPDVQNQEAVLAIVEASIIRHN